MTPNIIPSAQHVRAALLALSHAQVLEIARASSVPFTTLWKLRTGETENPRIETVRRIWPELVTHEHPAPEADQKEEGGRVAA